MAAEYTNRKIPRPASRPLETLTKIAAQNLDGYLFRIYLLSRTVVLWEYVRVFVISGCF